VFPLKPKKNFAQILAIVFEKNAKTAQLRHTPIPKKITKTTAQNFFQGLEGNN